VARPAASSGSLGSRRINEAMYGAVERWTERHDLAVHHVVGARDWDARPQPDTGELEYHQIRYEDRMDLVLAAADLAVCRSGGTTVAELAVVGVPAILVPLPIATRDHQRANAAALVRAGGAVLVADDDFDTDRLVAEVAELLAPGPDGEPVFTTMAAAAASLARPDAADRVADLVEAHARDGRDR
jgi:UDP-N-acetylglucosamine--N-acetylmuramyl-(pentapeptide) pyrophosphoryl-undecaprenol N-acetylglucosamine transferase